MLPTHPVWLRHCPFIMGHPSQPASKPLRPAFWLQIYWDGLLVASALTGKTKPLQPGGALMLGAEQDCYGGCTDRRGLPAYEAVAVSFAAAGVSCCCAAEACLTIMVQALPPATCRLPPAACRLLPMPLPPRLSVGARATTA
jgi:hypothetical protein